MKAAVYQKKMAYLAKKKFEGSSLSKKMAYLAKQKIEGSNLSKKNSLLSQKNFLEAVVYQKKWLT